MARRTAQYRINQDLLRQELLEVLNPMNHEQLQQFALDAYLWAQEHGTERAGATNKGWKPEPKASAGEHAAAFKSLTTFLGGGGCTEWALAAFEATMQQWNREGKWVPLPAHKRTFDLVAYGTLVAEADATLSFSQVLTIAQKLKKMIEGGKNGS